MKVRMGFVSNSSSSSFVVVGKVVSFQEFKKLTGISVKNLLKMNDGDDCDLEYDLEDELKSKCPNSKYNVLPFGNIGEYDEILMYYNVPNKPQDALRIIKDAFEEFGKDTVVAVVKQDSESGNYFGND